jgi:hypothetical protein
MLLLDFSQVFCTNLGCSWRLLRRWKTTVANSSSATLDVGQAEELLWSSEVYDFSKISTLSKGVCLLCRVTPCLMHVLLVN